MDRCLVPLKTYVATSPELCSPDDPKDGRLDFTHLDMIEAIMCLDNLKTIHPTLEKWKWTFENLDRYINQMITVGAAAQNELKPGLFWTTKLVNLIQKVCKHRDKTFWEQGDNICQDKFGLT